MDKIKNFSDSNKVKIIDFADKKRLSRNLRFRACSWFLSGVILLLLNLLILKIITSSYSNLFDESWGTRQFLIGMFMFTGLTIIPRLLQIQITFSGLVPLLSVNLSHHPTMLKKTHEIQISNLSICSGCFGSFLSILIAEFILLVFFFQPDIFYNSFVPFYFSIGLILIGLSYSKYIFSRKPRINLIQHTSLFIGLTFTFIACDLLFISALSMLLFLPIWLFFLIGRVYLGKFDHEGH